MEKKTVKLHTFNQLKDNPEILGNMANTSLSEYRSVGIRECRNKELPEKRSETRRTAAPIASMKMNDLVVNGPDGE